VIPFTLKEIAEACGGRLSDADPDRVVTAVVHDSRAVTDGALFVALPGERTDGHRFIDDALRAGAAAALARDDGPGARVIAADPLAALGEIAVAARARLSATTIAVTGSSGKTGTKDMIAAAVATEHRVVASAASFNNEIGVPLTVLEADERTEVLVLEVGSRGIGHIAALVPAMRPDVAVVTNVGSAHIGMFGSVEVTARAKAELVEALGPEDAAVLNADDALVAAMAARTAARVVTFGLGDAADVRAVDVTTDDMARASFTLVAGGDRVPVALAMSGEHMVPNALAAAAAATAVGVPLARAAEGLAACEGSAWRMEVRDARGLRILNDAYNANPDSMAAALKALVGMGRGRPTWAVLGHMAELGAHSVEAHDRIGRLAVRLGVRHLLTVGAEARATHEAARLEGFFGPDEAIFAPTVEDAIAVLRSKLEPDAVVLVKASRAAGLERIAEALA
jgi:UDP-N-acetylmuramoyl-tripeptide--D-alanyl-D-alanine ligase